MIRQSVARIKYLRYDQYLEEFDFLWDTFSKERVLKGSFDKFITNDAARKGTASVDKEFLQSLDKWRTLLATNINQQNHQLDEGELNFAVQQTIDRLIFLRIAEDRGVEEYGTLKKAVKSGTYYKNMLELFKKADEKYNSGLFNFDNDFVTTTMTVSNAAIKDIIIELYYPISPYEFSVLSVEILGSAYEQFLGKQICIDAKGKAVIEEKPSVRKAGGVYYTPQYIVDYIVQQTVGELCKGKTPKAIESLTILDPACGSGSFLLGAYDYLLRWHKDYYTNNPQPVKNRKEKPLTPDGYLTMAVKKQILLNNIYGVDIDLNAVEVTKLSLLLKCLEGETTASIQEQFSLWGGSILPTLDANIKSGNSLIGPDFLDDFKDEEQLNSIKPFNWQKSFSKVFKKGGFDVVIGNPPYGAIFSKVETDYFLKRFKLQNYQYDSYFLFIEKSLEILISKGLLGFIIPNTWLLNLTASKIRQHLFNKTELVNIVHYAKPVFAQAVVDTEIMIFRNTKPQSEHLIKVHIIDKSENESFKNILQKTWIDSNGSPVNIFSNETSDSLKEKFSKLPILDVLCKITQGTKPFQVGKGKPAQTRAIVDEKPFVSEVRIDDTFRPLLRGSLMNRYQINWKNNYWIKLGDWLAEPRYSASYDAKEKIVMRQTGDSLNATLDSSQFVVRDNLYTIVPTKNSINLHYILALINSKLLNWYYQTIVNPEKGEVLAQVKRGHIAQLPIREIDFKNSKEKAHHDDIVRHVENLLKLHAEKQTVTLATRRESIEDRIEHSERKINDIVYALYGITDEERAVIEG